MRTDWFRDGTEPTDDDVRRAKLVMRADNIRKSFFGVDSYEVMTDPEELLLDLAVKLIVEVATNREGIIGADAMADAVEYVGNEAHGFVD